MTVPLVDIDDAEIPAVCRVEQAAVDKTQGAPASRLHLQGEVLGRDGDRLIVRWDGLKREARVVPAMVRVLTEAWYLRTGNDADTHRGVLRADGVVVARCGIHYVPRWVTLRRVLAFPGYPPDPEQVCPDCKAVAR